MITAGVTQITLKRPLKNPVLTYFGGKFLLRHWIISFFPHVSDYVNYVEIFGGAASVLLEKPPSPLEVYNDADEFLTNFFAVLRKHRDELVRRLMLTPWSRVEFERCKEGISQTDDPIEQARMFYTIIQQSRTGSFESGWQRSTNVLDEKGTVRWKKSARRLFNMPDTLIQVAERLMEVQIDNETDIPAFIKAYDHTRTLFYADPPYIHKTRKHNKEYRHEMDDADHEEMGKSLNEAQGFALVSGYDSDLYRELFAGWEKVTTPGHVNGKGDRTECLWLNPKLANYHAVKRDAKPAAPVQMEIFQ